MDVAYPLLLGNFALTAFLIHVFRSPAEKIGLVDHPGGRKTHKRTVPLIGGIAIFLSFCFTVLFVEGALRPYSSLFAGMGILLIVGILDDLHDISALSKLILQILAAFLMVTLGEQNIVTSVGNLFGSGDIGLGAWKIPFTILCVVGLINAVNMIDGMDGLAGGVALTTLAWLAVIAIDIGAAVHATLLLLLIAGIIAFLLFNYRQPLRMHASVFLGDAGSMLIGFAIAWFAINLHQAGRPVGLPATSVAWLLALPVFDTIVLMARRTVKRQSPLAPDREHLHHIFIRAGFSQATTVNTLVAINFAAGAIGYLGWKGGVPEPLLFAGLLLLLIGHIYFVLHAWRLMKAMKRLRRWRKGIG